MKYKLNKRGSHVGVIISFVIFVTFLVFLYSIIQPVTKKQSDKKFMLEHLKKEILKKTSFPVTYLSIKIDNNYNVPLDESGEEYDCFEIEWNENEKVVVKDEENIVINSDARGNKLRIKWDNHNKKFFKIYSSKGFDKGTFSGTNCIFLQDSIYTKGLIKTEDYIFENELIKLTRMNEEDYKEVKKEMNVPEGFDFTFEFLGNVGGFTGNIPTAEVYAEEFPLSYMNNQADIIFGKIKITIW